jgi:hypothetical protein
MLGELKSLGIEQRKRENRKRKIKQKDTFPPELRISLVSKDVTKEVVYEVIYITL